MKKLLGTLAFFAPSFAFAATTFQDLDTATSGLTGVVENLTDAVNAAIPFMLAVAVIVFIYGVIKYVIASGPEAKKDGRSYIIYGVIGIAVIIVLFGLAKFLAGLFGIDSVQLQGQDIPTVPAGLN